MNKCVLLLFILLLPACSRLSTLTPEILAAAQNKWASSKPPSYQMVVEMSGDRVEKEQLEVTVQDQQIKNFRRNGLTIDPANGKAYSMDGLFQILHEELELAEKPILLGAPTGYSAYPMASFDDKTGRLLEYQRSVGGTSNTIHIRVLDFTPLTN